MRNKCINLLGVKVSSHQLKENGTKKIGKSVKIVSQITKHGIDK